MSSGGFEGEVFSGFVLWGVGGGSGEWESIRTQGTFPRSLLMVSRVWEVEAKGAEIPVYHRGIKEEPNQHGPKG